MLFKYPKEDKSRVDFILVSVASHDGERFHTFAWIQLLFFSIDKAVDTILTRFAIRMKVSEFSKQ